MSPYRESAALTPVVNPTGLVRANGSRCNCVPPGLLWCWWFGVLKGDAWYCPHGGGWLRAWDAGGVFVSHEWTAQAPGETREPK